ESSIEANRIQQPDPNAVSTIQTDSRVQAILKSLEPGQTYTTEEVRGLVNKQSGRRYNQGAIDTALLNLYGAQALETLPGDRVRLLPESDLTIPTDFDELAKSYGQTPEVQQSPGQHVQNKNAPASNAAELATITPRKSETEIPHEEELSEDA